MTTKKLRTIENLIILTFTVTIFSGCAGSDIKFTKDDQTYSSDFQQQPLNTESSFSKMGSSAILLAETTNDSDDMIPVEKELSSHSYQQENEAKTEKTLIPENKIFYFDTNAHVLSNDQRDALKKHAEFLIENSDAILIINGHADVRGSENYNQLLSEKRALETRQLLVKFGVDESQLVSKGFGELVPMHAENNWDENRRIELEYSMQVVLSSM